MARSIMEVAFISAEKVEFDNVKLVKLFVGDEPDGKRDLGISILSMSVAEESLDEVWAACEGLDVLEPIRVTTEIERGSKNAGKFIVLHVEPVKAANAPATKPTQPTPTAKPSGTQPEPAKAN
ncbi:hypothetical protein [Stutzerimonas balearica]|uniref:hypothetical protein n=1 Tax=Stutzerimonas balearica TaxID=74829 RepID=UPI00190B7036|nr:hypothetical protein [Stutzerimonas balearica]MBK3749282.1 hypothetical protein [Stutzerimonas balearica]MBK3827477.1 hypothetical protein [Stutzerimonas balearica]